MKKLLLPLILLLLGVGSGVGAGLFLKEDEPQHDSAAMGPCGDVHEADTHKTADDGHADDHDASAKEYAKLNNQFIVPVVNDGAVSSLVVISLSVEVDAGNKEPIFLAEPKLRDSFLQAMFEHANIGGFEGNFTESQKLRPLRQDLVQRGKSILPDDVLDVLIVDIVRQDV